MTNLTHLHPNASWRSAASRLRSCVSSNSLVIADARGMKPSIEVSIFGTEHPTRRGAPPH